MMVLYTDGWKQFQIPEYTYLSYIDVLIIGSYLVAFTRLHFQNLSVGTYFMNDCK